MAENDTKNTYLVGVVSLGCDKNRVDTENMMTRLIESKRFAFTGDPKEADVIIINTCAFISSARNEGQTTIKEMLSYKTIGNCRSLVVTGCYPQKYSKELEEKYPDVDIFLGTNEYEDIVSIILDQLEKTPRQKLYKHDSPYKISSIEKGRLITTPRHYAYIMVADGCDNFCSYCTIPYIRGRFRSRKIESIVSEATDLVKNGARELILVAQDVSKYGKDLYGELKLVDLIQQLSKIKDLVWIRLLYCYPENVSDELIEEIATNKKVCKYIDIPFQHHSDNILKSMNRHLTSTQIDELVEKINRADYNIAIRSTFIVGFPGETNKEYKELISFLKSAKLPNVGFFTYSREDGTVAARMDNQVSESTKQKRLVYAVRVQKKIVTEYNKGLIGKSLKVVVEGFDEKLGLFMGRSEYQAPDIDTFIYFSADTELKIGEFVKVKIAKVKGYDIYGYEEN